MKQKIIWIAIITIGALPFLNSCSTEEINIKEIELTAEDLQHGEELFTEVCTKCHRTSPPQSKKERKSMLAPPIMGVMFHVNDGVKANPENKKQAVIDFIIDYAHNPSAEKSFCEKGAIKRFGVMPSQKENITKEELTLVANYLYEKYPSKNINHQKLQKQMHSN